MELEYASQEIERNPDNTLMFHIVVTIAVMCMSWILFIKPATTIGPGTGMGYAMFTTFIWCLVLPSIILGNKALKGSVSGENTFLNIKFVSVAISVLVIQFFVIHGYTYGVKWPRAMTWIINMLLIINIGEACVDEFGDFLKNKSKSEVSNVEKAVDFINPVIGAVLIGTLFMNAWKGRGMGVDVNGSSVTLFSDMKPWFIIGYTAWNILFRVQLVQNTSLLIFLFLSILLPIAAHFAGWGDWLQVRGITLLILITITLGLGSGNWRIFPIYTQDGYFKEDDDKSLITRVSKEKGVKIFVLVLGILATIFAMGESYLQTNTFQGVFEEVFKKLKM